MTKPPAQSGAAASLFDNVVLSGYFPGAIGLVTRLHAVYYAEQWGFDLTFEAQQARELAEFLLRFRQDRDFFLTARDGQRLAGAVAMDGDAGDAPSLGWARLRWFIVGEAWRGMGLGRELLDSALNFARGVGYSGVYLWSFAGLDSARHLYEEAGFSLQEERPTGHWGREIVEQRFDLILGESALA